MIANLLQGDPEAERPLRLAGLEAGACGAVAEELRRTPTWLSALEDLGSAEQCESSRDVPGILICVLPYVEHVTSSLLDAG